MKCSRQCSRLLLLLCGFALLKLAFLCFVLSDPIYLLPQIDGKWYQIWANQIANGAVFSDQPFYQAPLYPYLLGLSYFVFGNDLWLTVVLQILLSLGTAFLCFRLSQKIFGDKNAWTTLILYLLTGICYFYELQPIKTTCVLFFTALTLNLSLNETPAGNFLTGITFGLLTLLRGNTFLVFPWIWAWRWFAHKKNAVLMGLGFLLPLCFSTYHNYQACGEFILSTYQGGTNFYIGNNPKATGVYMPLKMARQTPEYEGADAVELAQKLAKKELTYSQVSRFWFKEGWSFLWDNPKEWLKLWLKKLWLFFSPQEFPDGISYHFFRARYPCYHLLFVGYGLLWMLALRTFFSLDYRKKEIQLLLLFLVGSLVSIVPFYVFSRYRLPVIIGLLPFAAQAFKISLRWSFCLVFLGVFFQYIPIPDTSNSHYILGNLHARLYQQDQKETDQKLAILSYKNAIQKSPHFPEAWKALGTLYLKNGSLAQAEYCFRLALQQKENFVPALYYLGGILISKASPLPYAEKLSCLKEAKQFLEKAVAEEPESYQSLSNLGLVYLNFWKLDPRQFAYLQQAKQLIRKALMLKPGNHQLQKLWQELEKY